MRDRQRGQALVGAMVIMLILFALAGGVAVAASGLLQQSNTRGAAIADLSGQSASADAIAQVAGSSTSCLAESGGSAQTPFPLIDADDMASLALSFPDPVSANTSWTASCVRVDHAATPAVGGLWASLQWQSQGMSACGTQGLASKHVIVFLDARASNGGLVYVDDQPASAGCRASLPTSACSTTSPQPACVRCGKRVGSNLPLAQVTLDCDLSTAGTTAMYLHVTNFSPVRSPARFFTTGHDDNGGQIYLIATRQGSTPYYEESMLLVPPGGAASQLLYKEPLP